MLYRLPLIILLISFLSGQYIRVKCPFDATYIQKTTDRKLDEDSTKILWKYECGGFSKHSFFVGHPKNKDLDNSISTAERLIRSLPKPSENASLREIALYNRVLILLTWLDLEANYD